MSIRAISPVDGRYTRKTASLSDYFSEYALMKYRVIVEVAWLGHLAKQDDLPEIRPFSDEEREILQSIIINFDDAAAEEIKAIERTTNHDVKAVEYYVKSCLENTSLADMGEFVHFACTSEDINNLAYAMMLRDGLMDVWLPEAHELEATVATQAELLRDVAILARTHGQAATPTTLGKELAVYVARWQRQIKQIENQEFLGKFSGAVGAFNAHLAAYPDADWLEIASTFVESFGLVFNPLTTQIESHDYLAETFHKIMRFNTITLDYCRDMWAYISMGYFKQRTVEGEVGSSTMPHKVNPIDFENAEANIGLSNSILGHLAEKLMVSRLQRDLSDSSALRNIGTGIAHSHIALQSAIKGTGKVDVNQETISADLDGAWAVLAEPIQTVLRKVKYPNPYEKLKELTRGVDITRSDLHQFIATLPIPDEDKQRLQAMTPATYTGLADDLVNFIGE